MSRTGWAAAGGAAGTLVAGLLIVMGVQTHQSSEAAARAARQVADIQATAAADKAAADKAAADKAAADKAAADKAAAEQAAAEKVVADKKAADKAAADKRAAADKAAADKRAAKQSELLARSTVDAYFRAINATNYRAA
ncbi:hypothetical protein, partial [Actinoplanes sp. RD1]|uniref:hypothetical protein n=1 Tax=Actinoplanes sp. RD1 TaxID=3064538 RepID=UPI0027419938